MMLRCIFGAWTPEKGTVQARHIRDQGEGSWGTGEPCTGRLGPAACAQHVGAVMNDEGRALVLVDATKHGAGTGLDVVLGGQYW